MMYCNDCARHRWRECNNKPDDIACSDYVPKIPDMEREDAI